MNITQRAVDAAKPPESGSHILYDDRERGFGLRVTLAGVKAFVLNYRVGGRERRYTIGQHPAWSADAARAEAKELRVKIDKLNSGKDGGKDPLEERDAVRGEKTMSLLAAEFMDWAQDEKRPRSRREDQRMLDAIILPKLGRLRVSAVGRRDVEAMKASLRKTPVQANRVLSLLSKMFSCAVGWKMRADNPAHGVKHYHEEKREAWLRLEQLQALAKALDDYSDQNAADALRLLVLTGSRPQEVLTAEWSMFDLERGVWTKPSHHTKQKKTVHMPLHQSAVMILRRMAESREEGEVHLFPGKQDGRARTTLKNVWRAVCKAAGLATMFHVKGKRGKMLPRWRPNFRTYDLRHSFASHLVSTGQSLYSVGQLMGHCQASTTQRYAHLSDGAQRAVANAFPDVLGDQKKLPSSTSKAKTPTNKSKSAKLVRVPTLLAGD